jgi:hypothetical protein
MASNAYEAAGDFGAQNSRLLAELMEEKKVSNDVRQERDELLDQLSKMSEKYSRVEKDNHDQAEEIFYLRENLTEREKDAAQEMEFLRQHLRERDEEVMVGREEIERSRAIKTQLMDAVRERDTKIENLESAFKDLRLKYYGMCQEVETSKALALAIKEAAEEGATIAHSANLVRKSSQRANTNTVGVRQALHVHDKDTAFTGAATSISSSEDAYRRRQQQHPAGNVGSAEDKLLEPHLLQQMNKGQLHALRRKSQVGRFQPSFSNSSNSRPGPPAVRHTNGSYANVHKDVKNQKVRRATKKLAFGNAHQDEGRSAWIVHKDPYHFINNSSIEDPEKREFNSKSKAAETLEKQTHRRKSMMMTKR